MVTARLGALLLVTGGLYALAACSAPTDADGLAPLPTTASSSTVSTAAPDASTGDDDDDTGETGPVEVEGAVVDGHAVPADDVPVAVAAAESDAGVDAGPAPVMTITKSQTCTSKYAAHTSLAKLTWTVTGTKIEITALTDQVHNSDGRNLNDVDVYETQPGASEVKQFNSGDILVSDKNIIVGFNGNKAPKVGTKVRFSTNFDQSGADPSASCSVTVQ